MQSVRENTVQFLAHEHKPNSTLACSCLCKMTDPKREGEKDREQDFIFKFNKVLG